MEYNALWQSVLGEIELTISHAHYETWFSKTKLIELDQHSATITVINIFAKSQLEGRFSQKIMDILRRNGYPVEKINYKIQNTKKAVISRETTAERAQQVTDRNVVTVDDLMAQPADQTITKINPKYTFDNFVVGSSNDLAYTACQAIVANPGTKYNPLFIYGGVGLGKTHLMQAVGNAIHANDPKKRILYTPSEAFVKEFLESIRFKRAGFSDKYRNVDVLIVDDMQFIAGKEKTQEEFFHTFNALHQANKQIVISSDRPPRSIPTLTERLRSRFEWGMAIDIQMPDFETRQAIVIEKAARAGFELDSETAEYLAQNVKTNIRELEGVLNQMLAFCEMRDIKPDLIMAEGIITEAKHTRPRHLTPRQIIDKTARHFQIGSKEICSGRRDRHIVLPRQIAMYLLRSELHLSFPIIARELGRKDHTTAMHSINKIEKASKLDMTIRENIAEIRDKLYA